MCKLRLHTAPFVTLKFDHHACRRVSLGFKTTLRQLWQGMHEERVRYTGVSSRPCQSTDYSSSSVHSHWPPLALAQVEMRQSALQMPNAADSVCTVLSVSSLGNNFPINAVKPSSAKIKNLHGLALNSCAKQNNAASTEKSKMPLPDNRSLQQCKQTSF